MNSVAPKFLLSNSLSFDDDTAITFIPIFFANYIARWPRPPIPITEHVSPFTAFLFNGANVDIPAHINGADCDGSSPLGSANTNSAFSYMYFE